ncbi:MAG: hypothetical protein AAGC85_23450 [Bacteroidota bacterium]
MIAEEYISIKETEIESLAEKELESLLDRFHDEQSFLFSFLVIMGEENLREEEAELLLDEGLFIWYLLQAEYELDEVSPDELESLREENIEVLEKMEGEDHEENKLDFSELLGSYGEPELLKYLIEAVFEREQEVVKKSATRVSLFLYLKVILDALLQSVKRS